MNRWRVRKTGGRWVVEHLVFAIAWVPLFGFATHAEAIAKADRVARGPEKRQSDYRLAGA